MLAQPKYASTAASFTDQHLHSPNSRVVLRSRVAWLARKPRRSFAHFAREIRSSLDGGIEERNLPRYYCISVLHGEPKMWPRQGHVQVVPHMTGLTV